MFATDELLPALFKGNALDTASRARVRDGLVRFTGLSPEYIEPRESPGSGLSFCQGIAARGGQGGRHAGCPLHRD